jgi:hypothetical protein
MFRKLPRIDILYALVEANMKDNNKILYEFFGNKIQNLFSFLNISPLLSNDELNTLIRISNQFVPTKRYIVNETDKKIEFFELEYKIKFVNVNENQDEKITINLHIDKINFKTFLTSEIKDADFNLYEITDVVKDFKQLVKNYHNCEKLNSYQQKIFDNYPQYMI